MRTAHAGVEIAYGYRSHSRPGHVRTQPTTELYRRGWRRVFHNRGNEPFFGTDVLRYVSGITWRRTLWVTYGSESSARLRRRVTESSFRSSRAMLVVASSPRPQCRFFVIPWVPRSRFSPSPMSALRLATVRGLDLSGVVRPSFTHREAVVAPIMLQQRAPATPNCKVERDRRGFGNSNSARACASIPVSRSSLGS